MKTVYLEYKNEEEYEQNTWLLAYDESFEGRCKHDQKVKKYIFTTFIWIGGDWFFPMKRYQYTLEFCAVCSNSFDEEFKKSQDDVMSKLIGNKHERLAFTKIC